MDNVEHITKYESNNILISCSQNVRIEDVSGVLMNVLYFLSYFVFFFNFFLRIDLYH